MCSDRVKSTELEMVVSCSRIDGVGSPIGPINANACVVRDYAQQMCLSNVCGTHTFIHTYRWHTPPLIVLAPIPMWDAFIPPGPCVSQNLTRLTLLPRFTRFFSMSSYTSYTSYTFIQVQDGRDGCGVMFVGCVALVSGTNG